MVALIDLNARSSARPSELRLSPAFPYRPPRRVAPDFQRVSSIVGRMEADDGEDAISRLHTRGIARLFLGDAASAARDLSQAAHRAEASSLSGPRAAAIWNDLAVAHYELAKRAGAWHYVIAVDAVEKAWAADRSAAIAWTRAMLLEQWNLPNAAANAWKDYLKIDPTSEWAAEARERRSTRVKQELSSSFTTAVRTRLINACAAGDDDVTRSIVRAHAKEARTFAEDELLPKWAAAQIAGSADEAHVLHTLRSLGNAFRSISGEALLMDIVVSIDRTEQRHRMAMAILEYRAGRQAYINHEVPMAERRLKSAEEQLEALGNPLSFLANAYRAATVRMANRYKEVEATLDPIPPSRLSHYHALRALRGWILGLAYAQTGRPAAAVSAYGVAVQGFRLAGEDENVAGALDLRAEMLDYMTATDEAWTDRMTAVELSRHRGMRTLLWMNIALASVRDRHYRAADIVLTEITEDARLRGDAMWVTESAMWHAVVRSHLGVVITDADLDKMRRSLDSIQDASIRERTEANLRLVTAEIRTSKVSALELDDALSFYRKNDDRFNEMSALVQRVNVLASSAEFTAADATVIAALSHLEVQARDIADPIMRALFAERARHLFLLAADVQRMRNRPAGALWFSDRSRQVALRTFATPEGRGGIDETDAESLGRTLVDAVPAEMTVVYQDLKDDRLLTWVIRDGDFQFRETSVAEATVLADIEQFQTDLRRSHMDAVLRGAKNLYAKLLGPVSGNLKGSGVLIYSPSSSLRGVPFSALHDGRSFLIESRPIAVARSLSALVDGSPVTSRVPRTALVILPSAAPGEQSLPGARREAAAVSKAYGRTTSLIGNDATPEAFLEMASRYDVIHVAGHGRGDGRPLQSAIEFGSGRLRAFDVMSLHLPLHPIVVLAGCRTDDETERRATLSLAGAFKFAGAAAVVGSLWDVEDESTARLLTDFHRQLARGTLPAVALRLAQQAAIGRGDVLSWAAFQLQL